MADSLLQHCSPCGTDTWHESASFDDGLGDGTERFCVECGSAIFVSLAFVEPVALPLAA